MTHDWILRFLIHCELTSVNACPLTGHVEQLAHVWILWHLIKSEFILQASSKGSRICVHYPVTSSVLFLCLQNSLKCKLCSTEKTTRLLMEFHPLHYTDIQSRQPLWASHDIQWKLASKVISKSKHTRFDFFLSQVLFVWFMDTCLTQKLNRWKELNPSSAA